MGFSLKIKKYFLFSFFTVVVFSGALFFDVEYSSAAKLGSCSTGGAEAITIGEVDNQDECNKLCADKKNENCAFYLYNTPEQRQAVNKKVAEQSTDVLAAPFVWAIGKILTQIQSLVGWLFAISATLFAWVIEPANISGPNGLLNKQAVKDVWIMVRDVLNMTFILVLLFAAFGTIFQVDKWNLKKVWLSVLINALMVNFSYPIARFFIDVSNVAFYYLVNNLFSSTGVVTGSGIFAMFGTSSSIGTLLRPDAFTGDAIAYQVAMIVVTFIMGMTLMIIAALFIVRLIALTMLVMFSPVGFVGYIFPATAGYANDWWKNLFSYSFFAPIMIFIMAIALRVAEALKSENFQSVMSNASANTPAAQTTWIANAAFFTIPVIILWMGMGIAKSFGIAGADTVVSSVKKGGKWLANIPWAGAKMAGHATGIPGGLKQTKDYYAKRGIKFPGFKNRHFGSDQTEGTDSWVAQNVGRVPNAYDNNLLKKMGEANKEHNMDDMPKDQLNRLVERGSEYERLAAMEQLAKNGDITPQQLDGIMQRFGDKNQISKRILGKVKENQPELAFTHISDPGARENEMRKFINGDKFDVKKLGSSTLKNVEFMGAVISEGKLDQKAIDALNAKDKRNGGILKKAATDVAASYNAGNTNMANANTRNIMMAFTNATGAVHSAIGDPGQESARAEIFKKLNKDNAANITETTVNAFANEIARNMDSGKIVEIIKGMKDKAGKQKMVREIERLAGILPAEANVLALKKVIDNDSYLKSLK